MSAVGEPEVLTTGSLAARLRGTLRGRGDVPLRGIDTIADAGPSDVTFIHDEPHARRWGQSKAAAAIVTAGVEPVADHRPLIVVPNAELASAVVLECFQPPEDVPPVGSHPTSVIDPSAQLGQQVRIGPHVSVGRECVLGDGVVLHAGVRLYAGVEVGAGSTLHANVVVRERCKIGRGVILHQNVSIGADGFGYRPSPDGRGLVKIPHIGNVIIEDAVEIGANSCVDRAKFGSTMVGAGTKIDNLCQIAHNVRIGRACVLAGCSGVGGSTVIGEGVQIAGAVIIIDHLTIGNGAKIGARSTVLQDVPAGASYIGYPAGEGHQVLRQWASLRKLPDFMRSASKGPGRGPGPETP